jgi:AAA+ superfamily predicted ATPase
MLPELRRLDLLLEQAVAKVPAVFGVQPGADPFRGLHISQRDAERLFAHIPGSPVFGAGNGEGGNADVGPISRSMTWLARVFGLSPFDLDVVLIALAPELDLRYERLYAYLQDDVTKKRPTVDLALNLLCASAEARLTSRKRFATDSPLISHRLAHLIPDPHHVEPSLLARYVKLDDQIVRLLLEQDSLDSRLAPFCRMIWPAVSLSELLLSDETKRALTTMTSHARDERRGLRFYFHGPRGVGKSRIAEALAGEAGTRLLAVDLARLLNASSDFAQTVPLLVREAWFHDAILYLDNLDVLRTEERSSQYQILLNALAQDFGITILAGTQSWVPPGRGLVGVVPISFSIPDVAERQACWESELNVAGIELRAEELKTLTNSFRLTPEQITDAVATAKNQGLWRAAAKPTKRKADRQLTIHDLFVAARAQSGHDLATLTTKIDPLHKWEDIVLPPDTLAQLTEMCQRVAYRQRVLGDWGFHRKLSLGKGVNALFAGPSGTGKTMAAEIIANELGLDLYKIDLSGVVSKYIGETEKNLDRIFTTAENSNCILFFDEADALFGKRSEVRDSHDRYANIEISYLLQKMEQYEGIAILATNLRQNLDDAFVRRLAFTIHFPFPDEHHRRRIWAGIWPTNIPLADDLDVGFLSRQFKLSGGNIKNVALASAFLAAADGGLVTMSHLLHAIQREYQKLGKTLSVTELNRTMEPARA